MRTRQPAFKFGILSLVLAVCFATGLQLSGCAQNATSRQASRPEDPTSRAKIPIAGLSPQRQTKDSQGPDFVEIPAEAEASTRVHPLLTNSQPDKFLQQQFAEQPADLIASDHHGRLPESQLNGSFERLARQPAAKSRRRVGTSSSNHTTLPVQDLLSETTPNVQAVEHQQAPTPSPSEQILAELEGLVDPQRQLDDAEIARPFPVDGDATQPSSPETIALIVPKSSGEIEKSQSNQNVSDSLPVIRPVRSFKQSPDLQAEKDSHAPNIAPNKDETRIVTARVRLEQLLKEAHRLENQGQLHAAYRNALLAKQISDKHQLTVGLLDESPTVLAESIGHKIWNQPEPPVVERKDVLPTILPQRIVDHDQIFRARVEVSQWETIDSTDSTSKESQVVPVDEDAAEGSLEIGNALTDVEDEDSWEELPAMSLKLPSTNPTESESNEQSAESTSHLTDDKSESQSSDSNDGDLQADPSDPSSSDTIWNDSPRHEWQPVDARSPESSTPIGRHGSTQLTLAILSFAGAIVLAIVGLRTNPQQPCGWSLTQHEEPEVETTNVSQDGTVQAA